MFTLQRLADTPLIGVCLFAIITITAPAASADADGLAARYAEIDAQLQKNVYGIPIYLESYDTNGSRQGDVYGIINHPFTTVRDALGAPASWCDIVPQHLNIKACTYRHLDGQCNLSFYTGRKFYEKADNVYRLDYLYSQEIQQDNYFRITLSADKGPLDTSNYKIIVEAIPLPDRNTFIHFSYAYDQGLLTGIAMEGYFLTLGLGKTGFSITGEDKNGDPVYVSGARGVIERNSIRYYFAIQSYLDTINTSDENRFEARISKWFDLTEKHHKQLYEMKKDDYLLYKRMERADQLRLQAAVNATSASANNRTANGECTLNSFASK